MFWVKSRTLRLLSQRGLPGAWDSQAVVKVSSQKTAVLVGASALKGPHPERDSETVELPDLVALQKGVPAPQALHGEVRKNSADGYLLPSVEQEAPGIWEEAAGPSRGAPRAGPQLFPLRPG